MQSADLAKYKAMLEAKQSEMIRLLGNREELTEEIGVAKTADLVEEAQVALEREVAIRNLNRESRLLRDIRGALRRIAEGVYGVCLRCEQEIKPKRLEAVPWAAYCVSCQEILDQQGSEDAEPIEPIMAETA